MGPASWLVASLALWMHADRSLFQMLRTSDDEGITAAEGTSSGVNSTDGNHVDLGVDACNADYVIGKDACHCQDKAHEPILEEEMCIQAAKEAGAKVPIKIEEKWFGRFPKGCFKSHCMEDETNGCYFFNPTSSPPAVCRGEKKGPHVEGIPVCRGAKYLDPWGSKNGRCPTGYAPLTTSIESCSEAGMCLGYCQGDFARLSQEETSYPQGCFLHAKDFCFYFNPNGGKQEDTEGTQLCASTNVMKNANTAKEENSPDWGP